MRTNRLIRKNFFSAVNKAQFWPEEGTVAE